MSQSGWEGRWGGRVGGGWWGQQGWRGGRVGGLAGGGLVGAPGVGLNKNSLPKCGRLLWIICGFFSFSLVERRRRRVLRVKILHGGCDNNFDGGALRRTIHWRLLQGQINLWQPVFQEVVGNRHHAGLFQGPGMIAMSGTIGNRHRSF